ncbi:hypothetical protein [Lysobacter gummosus]|uniref:hypothetical protein n=1 Tax=Lysobacter gummosus TaxID=262324 RepID=UPI0036298A07
MIKLISFIAIWIATTTALAGCVTSTDTREGQGRTKLCDLIENSKSHSGKQVHLLSKIKASSHSAMVLYDDSCSESVVALDVPHKFEQNPTLQTVMRLVWEGYPAPSKSDAFIDISGRFEFAEGEVPSRYLVVSSIEAVESRPKSVPPNL